jgi:hypothetical protein
VGFRGGGIGVGAWLFRGGIKGGGGSAFFRSKGGYPFFSQ